jgi:hypothetical protein
MMSLSGTSSTLHLPPGISEELVRCPSHAAGCSYERRVPSRQMLQAAAAAGNPLPEQRRKRKLRMAQIRAHWHQACKYAAPPTRKRATPRGTVVDNVVQPSSGFSIGVDPTLAAMWSNPSFLLYASMLAGMQLASSQPTASLPTESLPSESQSTMSVLTTSAPTACVPAILPSLPGNQQEDDGVGETGASLTDESAPLPLVTHSIASIEDMESNLDTVMISSPRPSVVHSDVGPGFTVEKAERLVIQELQSLLSYYLCTHKHKRGPSSWLNPVWLFTISLFRLPSVIANLVRQLLSCSVVTQRVAAIHISSWVDLQMFRACNGVDANSFEHTTLKPRSATEYASQLTKLISSLVKKVANMGKAMQSMTLATCCSSTKHKTFISTANSVAHCAGRVLFLLMDLCLQWHFENCPAALSEVIAVAFRALAHDLFCPLSRERLLSAWLKEGARCPAGIRAHIEKAVDGILYLLTHCVYGLNFWGQHPDVLDENWKEVIDLPVLLAIISEEGVMRFLKSSSRAELLAECIFVYNAAGMPDQAMLLWEVLHDLASKPGRQSPSIATAAAAAAAAVTDGSTGEMESVPALCCINGRPLNLGARLHLANCLLLALQPFYPIPTAELSSHLLTAASASAASPSAVSAVPLMPAVDPAMSKKRPHGEQALAAASAKRGKYASKALRRPLQERAMLQRFTDAGEKKWGPYGLLNEHHRKMLRTQAWISSDIFSATGAILQKQFPDKWPKNSRDCLAGSAASSSRSSLKPIPLEDHFLQWLHVNGNHWVLFCTAKGGEPGEPKQRFLLDSLGLCTSESMIEPQNQSLVEMLRAVTPGGANLSVEELVQSINFIMPQKQQGNNDCGCFVIAWVVIWLRIGGLPTHSVHLDLNQLRGWLEQSLESECFELPPTHSRASLAVATAALPPPSQGEGGN